MKRLAIISAIVLGMATTSCDSYLDINTDPNSPTEDLITSDMLLPAAEMNVAASYGDFLRIVGGYFSQHFSQQYGTGNYLDFSQFTMSATRSSGCYTQLNSRALKSINTILEKAEAGEDWGTFLAATTLKAFVYQALVDCYGEVPYSEAMDSSNPTPKYDEGADIYAGILAEIDNALSKASATDQVATSLLYPSATASSWIKFAKALKLKILMRESGAVDVQSELDALVAEGDFPTSNVEFKDCWSNSSGQMNPYYSEEFSSSFGSTQENEIANIALVGTMQQDDYTDPRLAVYVDANDEGKYVGGVSGTNFSTSSSLKAAHWCRPAASYDMPVSLISLAEVEFFLSEYYAKKGNSSEASSHYRAAIEASFSDAGVSGVDEYLAKFPFDSSNYKKSIGIAKWVALAGCNDFEAWCELRRLDYPAFGSVSGSDIYNVASDTYDDSVYEPGTLYTPIQVDGNVGANKVLERFPYAESSSSRNSNTPDFPGYTSPVFWGK